MFTDRDFLRKPTSKQWARELANGWPGPDGSSMSTDKICGVRIGTTSREWEHCDLAANFHDWLYRLGRRMCLGEHFRKLADICYRDMCLKAVRAELSRWNPLQWVAVGRCHGRYAMLRATARFAFTARAKVRKEKFVG